MIKKTFLSVILCAASMLAMAQAKTVTHVVQRGETIESIAEYYNVSVADINRANPNADGIVYMGMKLNIPTSGSVKQTIDEKNKQPQTKKYRNNVNSNNNGNIVKYKETEANPTYNSNNSFVYGEGSSFSFLYQSEAEVYGLQMEFGTNLFCLTSTFMSDLEFGGKKTSSSAALLGAGVRRKIVFGDNFLIQGKLYPYIGLSYIGTPKNTETGQEAEDKTKFTYGASADLSIGFKICNTAKGNSTFLHVGYVLMAGEFETKGLFKNGAIMLGLTTILK